jgi:hypothetical protein
MATHNPSNMRWDGQMSANTWALTLVLHRTQRVADEAINRALDGILTLAAFRFQNLFSTRETTPGSCNNTLRRPLRHGAQRPRTSGGRPAALRVTGDAARRLRYPSRAKHTKPTSRSRTVCTMARHDATGVTTPRQTVKASPHRHKWMLSHGAPADPSDPWNSHAAPVSPRQNGQRDRR